jgi:hypothetical protein
MRVVVTTLLLAISAGAALAQTGSITPAPPATPAPSAAAPAKSAPAAPAKAVRTGKSAVADAKAECMKMWDSGTHMSRQEWSSTCDRIQTRLDNLKVENLDVMGTGVRKKTGAGKQGSVDLKSRPN